MNKAQYSHLIKLDEEHERYWQALRAKGINVIEVIRKALKGKAGIPQKQL
jgi:hypothetical protein